MRLWHRLFLAFAVLSIGALAAFAVVQQRSFQRGFLGYLNQLGVERITAAAQMLGDDYARRGSWEWLRDDPRALMGALGLRPPNEDGRPPPPGRFGEGPPPRERFGDRRPPPRWDRPPRDEEGERLPPGWDAPPPRDAPPDENGREPPPPPPGPPDLRSRLLLVDNEGLHVAGNPNVRRDDATPIEVRANGRKVGTLLLAALPRPRNDLDVAFADAQTRQALLTALVVLLFALPIAWALASRLLAPIRALGVGTRALADGAYNARVDALRSDELGALAKDFNHLAETLERHQNARRQWAADIAHELRTPLSILQGEIQALQDGVRQVSPNTLASLHGECERLSNLVEDLYELSLSDAGALAYRFETVDLAELLRELAITQRSALSDAGLALSEPSLSEREMPTRGDARRLAQLFSNLLANARRYSDRGGRVELSARRETNDWVIDVDDTPPSVPADALPKLFDRLYRVDASRSRESGGAGLGLAICRNIVLAHDGRIEALPSPLGGLRVRVRLPVSTEQS